MWNLAKEHAHHSRSAVWSNISTFVPSAQWLRHSNQVSNWESKFIPATQAATITDSRPNIVYDPHLIIFLAASTQCNKDACAVFCPKFEASCMVQTPVCNNCQANNGGIVTVVLSNVSPTNGNGQSVDFGTFLGQNGGNGGVLLTKSAAGSGNLVQGTGNNGGKYLINHTITTTTNYQVTVGFIQDAEGHWLPASSPLGNISYWLD